MGQQISKKMAATLSEFHRSLSRFLPSIEVADGQRDFLWSEGEKRLSIQVSELPPKTMGGMLKLPQMDVTLSFDGYDAEERGQMLARFDLAFQRGGG